MIDDDQTLHSKHTENLKDIQDILNRAKDIDFHYECPFLRVKFDEIGDYLAV